MKIRRSIAILFAVVATAAVAPIAGAEQRVRVRCIQGRPTRRHLPRRHTHGLRNVRKSGPCRDRTCDLGIKSPLLYQLS